MVRLATSDVSAEPTVQGMGSPSSRIAGFLPTTMLDWPGRVSCVVFLSGCTLRCPYCHNPELVPVASARSSWQSVLSYLSVRRGWIDGVVISGGEPTTDPDLLNVLESFASRGMPIKLDTNGTDPRMLERIIHEGLIEHVALDVKTFPDRYQAIGLPDTGQLVQESISVVLSSGISHEFRTTVYPPMIALHELPSLAALLADGDSYVLQQFRPGRTLDSRAALVSPPKPDELLGAAAACSRYLPTTTRGV